MWSTRASVGCRHRSYSYINSREGGIVYTFPRHPLPVILLSYMVKSRLLNFGALPWLLGWFDYAVLFRAPPLWCLSSIIGSPVPIGSPCRCSVTSKWPPFSHLFTHTSVMDSAYPNLLGTIFSLSLREVEFMTSSGGGAIFSWKK